MKTFTSVLAIVAFASTLVAAVPNPGNGYPSPSYPSPSPYPAPGYPSGGSGSGGSGGSGSGSEPDCGGNTSACCNGETVQGSTVVTGCARYSAQSELCQASANLYCCATLLDTLCVLGTGGS